MSSQAQEKNKNIVVFGAGLSATSLIKYLLENSEKYGWKVSIVDRDEKLLKSKAGNHPNAEIIVMDVTDSQALAKVMSDKDVAISLLPPEYHVYIAQGALNSKTHLFNASYVLQEIRELEDQIEANELVFMSELGVDPGIDHLSLVKIIHELKDKGAELLDVKTMTGALVSPEDLKDNPLKYKFTWNPDNVVRAGEYGGGYVKDHKSYFVDYKHVFSEVTPVEFEDIQDLYVYYNRDATPYLGKYNIEMTPNFMRGTLRYHPFLKTWDVLVQSGITNERLEADTDQLEVGEIFANYLGTTLSLADYLRKEYPEKVDDEVYNTLLWLNLDSTAVLKKGEEPIYRVLMYHLIPILKLLPEDRDLILMKHKIEYSLEGEKYLQCAYLRIYGKNANSTAISDTVGLPLAIFTKLFLEGEIELEPGLHLPTDYNLTNPILDELEDFGIKFRYETKKLN